MSQSTMNPLTLCAHCKEPLVAHGSQEKCLFDTTTFRAMTFDEYHAYMDEVGRAEMTARFIEMEKRHGR